MIGYFALALSHALLVVALLRLARRDDLDREDRSANGLPPAEPESVRAAKRRRRGRA